MYRDADSPWGGDITPEDAAYVDKAMSTIEGIKKAAGGRPLTRTQQHDFDANLEIARAVLGKYDEQDHHSFAGVALRRFLETGDPSYGREAERSARTRRLQAQSDAFRGITGPIVERGGGSREPSMRDLFRAALDQGAAAFESDFSPLYLESRALQSQGGSAIPTTFVDRVSIYARTLSPLMDPGLVTLLERPDGQPLQAPRLTGDPAMGGTVTAEAAGINELDSTISAATLTFFKYGITQVYSAELAEDNVVGLEDLIARAAARELSIDIGAHLTTGSGSGQPMGFVTAATNGGTATGTAGNTSADTFFGPVDLIDLKYSAPAETRANGVFLVSSTAMAKMRKFRDSNKQFLFQPSLVTGFAGTFDGSPVVEVPAMAAVSSASKSVAFGDMRQFYVARTGLRVEISRDYKFATDQLALRTIWRVAANLVDTSAIRYLVSADS